MEEQIKVDKSKCYICGKECTNIYIKLDGGKQLGPLCKEHSDMLTEPEEDIENEN